jgi:hypothetical protein
MASTDPTASAGSASAAKPGAGSPHGAGAAAALGSGAAPAPEDADVRVALSLGWSMAELYYEGLPRQTHVPSAGARLPGIGRLSPSQRALLRLEQIDAAVAHLAGPILAGGLRAPTTRTLRTVKEDPAATGAERRQAIYALHVELLRVLTAADFRLGKAYGLGRALADCCQSAADLDALVEHFGRRRLDVLRTWLNDAASYLPEHSAKAVLAGLTRWEAWVSNARAATGPAGWEQQSASITATLHRQAELWRSVLSGEKDARDMLTVESYLKAVTALRTRVFSLVRPWLYRYGPWLLGFFAVVGLVLGLLITNGTSQLVVGITAVAGALGISGRTLGAAFQKVGSMLEQPVWGAELDAAVAEALTNLPFAPVREPRPDLLLDTPLYLRAVGSAQPTTVEELCEVAAARPSDPQGNLSFRERWSIRSQRAPWRKVSMRETGYWLNWALAAEYVQDVHPVEERAPATIRPAAAEQLQASAQANGTERYKLTDEGRQLASIPRGETGTVAAALTAARRTVEIEPEPEPKVSAGGAATESSLAPGDGPG